MEDTERNDSYVLKLIHTTFVYPLSTAVCERAYSTMKIIKTDWHCNLGHDTLDDLMRIKLGGLEGALATDAHTPRRAVQGLWISGPRMRRTNVQAYGARNVDDKSNDSDSN